MSPDTKQLLLILAISLPVGLIVGILFRKLSPQSCKKYAKWCLNGRWKLFLFGFIMFTIFAISSFYNSKPAFGYFFSFFAIFEVYAIRKYGFTHLTPEQEEAINNSDPTQLLTKWKTKKMENKSQ